MDSASLRVPKPASMLVPGASDEPGVLNEKSALRRRRSVADTPFRADASVASSTSTVMMAPATTPLRDEVQLVRFRVVSAASEEGAATCCEAEVACAWSEVPALVRLTAIATMMTLRATEHAMGPGLRIIEPVRLKVLLLQQKPFAVRPVEPEPVRPVLLRPVQYQGARSRFRTLASARQRCTREQPVTAALPSARAVSRLRELRVA